MIFELCNMKRKVKKLINEVKTVVEANTPYKVLAVFEPEVDSNCEPQVMTIEILVKKK